jgi:hypothetical protein
MIQAAWRDWTDPNQILNFIHRSAWASRLFVLLGSRKAAVRQRKYRLCICACCRTKQAHLSESAVEVAERYADGLATKRELRAARNRLTAAAYGLTGTESWWQTIQQELSASTWEIATWLLTAASAHELAITDEILRGAVEMLWNPNPPHGPDVRCTLVRDLFGNPFHRSPLAPSWLTWHDGLIVSMARQIYESRNFTDMPILADALEEAGCTNAGILNHCRQPGEHVRGCWVIDLILGKE